MGCPTWLHLFSNSLFCLQISHQKTKETTKFSEAPPLPSPISELGKKKNLSIPLLQVTDSVSGMIADTRRNWRDIPGTEPLFWNSRKFTFCSSHTVRKMFSHDAQLQWSSDCESAKTLAPIWNRWPQQQHSRKSGFSNMPPTNYPDSLPTWIFEKFIA